MIDPQQVREVKRALGVRLAECRRALGVTQADVAARVHSTRSTVAGVECGSQVADRVFWQRCDEALRAGGELLAGYDEYRRLKQRHDEEKAEAGQRARWGEVARVQVPGSGGSSTGADHESLADARVASPGVGLAPAGVDPVLALHWIEMLRLLSVSHNMFGPRQIYEIVCRESSVIRRYRHDATADVEPGFLAVEARWAEFGSWAADNLGNVTAASHWLDRALGLAHRAADKRMAAYVLMRQAQQAADRLDGDQAAALAATAESLVPLTDRDRALCLIRQAQGHALGGDQTRSLAALNAAHRLVDRAAEAGEDDPDTIGRHCTLAYLRAYEGYCLLRLGLVGPAARTLKEILEGWPSDYRQDEALTRAWLALAYAAAGELTEASAEGSHALTLTATTNSARAMRPLHQLHARLAGQTASEEAVRFTSAFSLVVSTVRL
ncbi:helix-turn-helix domain-containing protein [Micromonospora humida]|uniref:helix-turn-helix domain-containing protein n=1 Tax=Micromonospora humida TaxID=2809018 RepID=UPI003672B6E3